MNSKVHLYSKSSLTDAEICVIKEEAKEVKIPHQQKASRVGAWEACQVG
jgi:hypothetical protein